MQKYEILDVIDEGAYGIVWKAVNRENGGLGTSGGSELPLRSSKRAMRTSSRDAPSNGRSRC